MSKYLIDNIRNLDTELQRVSAQTNTGKNSPFPYKEESYNEFLTVLANSYPNSKIPNHYLSQMVNIILYSAHPREYIIEEIDTHLQNAFDRTFSDMGETINEWLKLPPSRIYIAKGNLPKARLFVDIQEPTADGNCMTVTKSCAISYAISMLPKYAAKVGANISDELKILSKYK
ncbi:MAG: hypothetical protein ACRDD8_10560 [Bacteroidales bacterium]